MYVLVGADPQRERLQRAYAANLKQLGSKDVPAEIRGEFALLATTMRSAQACTAGGMSDTAESGLDERQVAAAIHAILRMYDIVARYQPLRRADGEAKTADWPAR